MPKIHFNALLDRQVYKKRIWKEQSANSVKNKWPKTKTTSKATIHFINNMTIIYSTAIASNVNIVIGS